MPTAITRLCKRCFSSLQQQVRASLLQPRMTSPCARIMYTKRPTAAALNAGVC